MLEVHPEVAAALAGGRPVVALESAFLTHGLPPPHHLAAARAMIEAVRAGGAVPAMVAVAGGRLMVGLAPERLEELARTADVAKVSRRDLGPVLASGGLGGTTVSATLTAAASAGLRVLATGGIGGVHRDGAAGAENRAADRAEASAEATAEACVEERAAASVDVSADLGQIGQTAMAVICSGAKAVLDLPRTLELLETLGVPVLGYGTDELPAFYSRRSGLALAHRVDDPAAAAAVLAAHWQVESSGIVVAVPPPADSELDPALLDPLIDEAVRAARTGGVGGAAATPFLLDRLAQATGGRSVETNVALLTHNAAIAAAIAAALP